MARWKNTPLPYSLQLWGLQGGTEAWKHEQWEGQPLRWKKVEECLQLRPRINKPHSGLGWWQEARFSAWAWQSLRQGLWVSNKETEAPRGPSPSPPVLSSCLQGRALSHPLIQASVSPLE